MGIDVQRKEVFYTDQHQNLVDTSVEKNPFYQSVDGLAVRSVFRRRKASRQDQGDGNPLIYALKRTFGYRIKRREIARFLPNLRAIVEVAMQEEPYDAIVALPSSHPIAWTLATRASLYQPEAQLIRDLFVKCTNGEVLAGLQQALAASQILQKDRGEVTSLISVLSRSPDQLFSLKLVESHLRHYTLPFRLSGSVHVQNQSILIVDDLLSSGTSLRTANQLLKQSGAVRVSALCLLSSLGKGKPRD